MLAPESATPLLRSRDPHDRKLLEQVRPPDWQNPEPRGRYDLVVLGAGTAGLVSAAGAAGLGARVALVERHLLGGDCLNVGCVPSKGVISAARVWHQVFDGAAFGAPPHVGTGDFARAMERMRRLRAAIAPNDGAARFRDLGVDVYFGEGRFVSPDVVEVGGRRLEFKRAVIATGGRAAAPPIAGLETVPYLTNETVFSLTALPRRLAILGAGPIGCELAQGFARFGSQVTVLELLPRIMPREDEDAAALVAEALRRDGVTLELGVKIDQVATSGRDKDIRYTREGGEGVRLLVDELLVATGRAPNTEGLGLQAARIEYGPKGVKVDDQFRTTHPKVFACGDVASPLQFTHAADAQARAVLRNALFGGRIKASDLLIPWCTYTSPEVAHVGLYPREAQGQGLEVETIRVELAEVDRARLDGEEEGFLKVHTRAGTDKILGATLVAARAGDMIGELCLAIHAGIGLKTIADTVHPYPTQGEVVKKAADAWNRRRLTPRAKRMLAAWFRLLR
jgi:pyruvate/2-oxoglutarate dehydrogenase complex dihydrolipoamide dehydrogenase (E3) component